MMTAMTPSLNASSRFVSMRRTLVGLHGQRRRELDLFETDHRADIVDARHLHQAIGEEVAERLEVVGDDLEQIVVLAGDAVALEDLREGADLGFDLANAAEVVAADADAHVSGHAEANRFRSDVGAVAANDAALLERSDAAKRLGRREPDSAGQVDVGDPALVLDDVENLVV